MKGPQAVPDSENLCLTAKLVAQLSILCKLWHRTSAEKWQARGM